MSKASDPDSKERPDGDDTTDRRGRTFRRKIECAPSERAADEKMNTTRGRARDRREPPARSPTRVKE